MAAEVGEYVVWFGLALRDPAGYAEYRRRMLPVLERYGGHFEYDFNVSEVLRQPGQAPIERVFSIVFPDRKARETFFSDADYRAIRAAHFEPSVSAVTPLASFER